MKKYTPNKGGKKMKKSIVGILIVINMVLFIAFGLISCNQQQQNNTTTTTVTTTAGNMQNMQNMNTTAGGNETTTTAGSNETTTTTEGNETTM
jgi:uncharacterized protein YpmB